MIFSKHKRPRHLRFLLSFLLAAALIVPAFAGEREFSPLVDIHDLDPTIVVDIRYATDDNFMNEVLYSWDRCYLRPSVAERLVRVQENLRAQKLGLKVYDCYRPLSVQKKMFERFPFPGFVADPKKGSKHNRGAAVDVGLVDPEGSSLPMPSVYDEFSPRSGKEYAGGTEEERRNREVLRQSMENEGFGSISTEWWHFNDPEAVTYSLLDIIPSS